MWISSCLCEFLAAPAVPICFLCWLIDFDSFSARLPGPCDSLNRKLGGPVAQSPPKEKAAKPASVVKVKPGAPMKRPTALKRDKDRTLERALSVERSRRSVSHGPAATIALLRSASQTVIPGLKREASESSLMGLVPRAESTLLKERPSKLFARSVSLSGTDLKAQRKAKVEAELKDAISALKKPNRSLAAKDFVEAANRRATAGQLKSSFPTTSKQLRKRTGTNRTPYRDEKTQPSFSRPSQGHTRQQPLQRRPRSRTIPLPTPTLPRHPSLQRLGGPSLYGHPQIHQPPRHHPTRWPRRHDPRPPNSILNPFYPRYRPPPNATRRRGALLTPHGSQGCAATVRSAAAATAAAAVILSFRASPPNRCGDAPILPGPGRALRDARCAARRRRWREKGEGGSRGRHAHSVAAAAWGGGGRCGESGWWGGGGKRERGRYRVVVK